jgi:hypothetical protein
MPNTHSTKRRGHKPDPEPSDKKAHTAGIGILLILLTNYQSEIKQVFSALMKVIT